MKLILVCLSLCALPGCALLLEAEGKAARAGGELVKFYCENAADPAFRERFRDEVNAYAAPHSVRVDCAQPEVPPLLVTPP